MTKYYTRSGDTGTTGTLGGPRVAKDSDIAIAVGDVDELNSAIGVAIANLTDPKLASMLVAVQDRLFIIGAELSRASSKSAGGKVSLDPAAVKDLEGAIEEFGSRLPELKKFVLPGGSASSAYLHLSRAICRRAERSVVALSKKSKFNPEIIRYLNRLSSFLFVAALYINRKDGIEESHPNYG